MSKLIIAAASMLIGFAAYADEMEVKMVEVEMTPITEAQKPVIAAKKADSRFANYALESFNASGLQQ